MEISKSSIVPDVIIFKPKVFFDNRGCFFESYNDVISETLKVEFVQDNHSISNKNVIRGLHYQWEEPVGKLCRCIKGSLTEFVVDIRKDSPTYGKWDSFHLDDQNNLIVWIPPGFAHGFIALEDDTRFLYKCTALWNKNGEGSINPFDEELNIVYGISKEEAILSDKDRDAQSFLQYSMDPKFFY